MYNIPLKTALGAEARFSYLLSISLNFSVLIFDGDTGHPSGVWGSNIPLPTEFILADCPGSLIN